MRKLKTIEIARLTNEEFQKAEKMPLIVVLDNVRSLLNVGSIFRTADAFRVEAVYLCGITATPPNSEIHKTALGGEESVHWEYFDTADQAVNKLHSKGYRIFSIEQAEGATMLDNYEKETTKNVNTDNQPAFPPTAIVFGNEVKGVSQSVIDASDGCLEIPQYGTKHSMNVAVSVGIVMWEMAKHYWKNR